MSLFFRHWRPSQRKLRTKQDPVQAGVRTRGLHLFRIPSAGHPRGGAAVDQEQDGATEKDHGRAESQEENEERGQVDI